MNKRDLIAAFVKELLDGNRGKAKKLLHKFISHHSKKLVNENYEDHLKDDNEDDEYPPKCTDPKGHDWANGDA